MTQVADHDRDAEAYRLRTEEHTQYRIIAQHYGWEGQDGIWDAVLAVHRGGQIPVSDAFIRKMPADYRRLAREWNASLASSSRENV